MEGKKKVGMDEGVLRGTEGADLVERYVGRRSLNSMGFRDK